jgi:hypothetical protein
VVTAWPEVWFGIITRQAIRRGSFDSVSELIDAIRREEVSVGDRRPWP